MAVSADDNRIAVGLDGGKLFIFSLKYKTSSLVETNISGNIDALSFYPFKKHIVVIGGHDGSVATVDINEAKVIMDKKAIHSAPVTGNCF